MCSIRIHFEILPSIFHQFLLLIVFAVFLFSVGLRSLITDGRVDMSVDKHCLPMFANNLCEDLTRVQTIIFSNKSLLTHVRADMSVNEHPLAI